MNRNWQRFRGGGEKVLQVLIVVIIFFAMITAVLAHINPGNGGVIWGVFAIFLLLILQRYIKLYV